MFSEIGAMLVHIEYGHLKTNKINNVIKFVEKPILDMPINIGYYLFNKDFFIKNYSKNKELESEFLKAIVKKKKLVTYLHQGFFFNIDKKIDLVKLKKEKKIFIKDF